MNTDCARKRGVKAAREVWGLTAGRVGSPSVGHLWGKVVSGGRVKFEVPTGHPRGMESEQLDTRVGAGRAACES